MKRRAPGVGCRNPGRKACRRDAVTSVDGKRLCAMHAADRLFARAVRESGPCFAAGFRFLCNEGMQCAHIITRARKPTRWDFANAVPLCSGHHVWFTHSPDTWVQFVRDKGIDYDALHQRAWSGVPQNPLDVIAELQGVAT